MGIRYRKSIGLGGGIRLNLSKSGIGLSAGIPGLRYSVNSKGQRRRSVGIPGTGIYSVSTSGSGRRRSQTAARRSPAAAPVDPRRVLPKPGLFAGAAEKRYHEGVLAYLAGDNATAFRAFEASLAAGADSPSARLFAALAAEKIGGPESTAITHLEAVIASPHPLPDKLQAKYLPASIASLSLKVAITEHISAEAPVSSIGAALILAEHYQAANRLSEAIGLIHQVQQVDSANPVVALSLADLLYADGDYEGVLEAAANAANDSDLGVALLHLRAAALFAQGHSDAAFEMFKQALAKTAGRDAELLKVVRYDRALAYDSVGQKAKAKADLERIYAVDPDFQDVRERLAVSA